MPRQNWTVRVSGRGWKVIKLYRNCCAGIGHQARLIHSYGHRSEERAQRVADRLNAEERIVRRQKFLLKRGLISAPSSED